MLEILKNGGLGTGGINFDAKVRRSSFAMEDLVLAHIAGMDTFARGLKSAAKLRKNNFFEEIKEQKYESYKSGIGKLIVEGKETLDSLCEYALLHDEPKLESSHIESVKSRLNDFLV